MVFSVHAFSLSYEDKLHKCRVYSHVREKMHAFETLYIFSQRKNPHEKVH